MGKESLSWDLFDKDSKEPNVFGKDFKKSSEDVMQGNYSKVVNDKNSKESKVGEVKLIKSAQDTEQKVDVETENYEHVDNSQIITMARDRLHSLDLQQIAESEENYEGRVQVDQKSMINCRADVNQLVPFKYPWAWQKYLDGCANHWMPQEINMTTDQQMWSADAVLSEEERRIIMRSLGFFSTADSLVANNLVLALYKHITNPECRQYLLRQAFEEAIHTHAYQYCVESLGMDEGEVFNMYREVKSVADKAGWCIEYTRHLSDPDFKTGTTASDSALLENLIAFYCVMEGLFFYCGFSQVLSMGRLNKMPGVASQFQYILRDESMHVNFGIDMINQIRNENPHLWTDKFCAKVRRMVAEGVELEIEFARDTMPKGTISIDAASMEEFLKFIGNRRLSSLGLPVLWNNVSNTLPWMSEIMDLRKEKNFFETHVTEYQVGGTLSW